MKRAMVLVADGTEELEAVTIIDVLRRAHVEVVVVGLKQGPIVASRGVKLIPDVSLDEVALDSFDALVLPGGNGGTQAFEADERVLDLVRKAARGPMILAAICAAPRVLKKAGVLGGQRVTSYPGALDPKDASCRYEEAAVVVDGHWITSRGPGTALDFALTLVQELLGADARSEVEGPLIVGGVAPGDKARPA